MFCLFVSLFVCLSNGAGSILTGLLLADSWWYKQLLLPQQANIGPTRDSVLRPQHISRIRNHCTTESVRERLYNDITSFISRLALLAAPLMSIIVVMNSRCPSSVIKVSLCQISLKSVHRFVRESVTERQSYFRNHIIINKTKHSEQFRNRILEYREGMI